MVSINTTDSKLRTYGELKTIPGLEPYLQYPMKIQYRIMLSKFRLSNHVLLIEKGRHVKIDRSQRFCPICPNTIETEHHFLLNCQTYSIGRNNLFCELAPMVPQLNTLSEKEKFVELMTNETCIPKTAEFISTSFDIREFLTSKHKNYQ